MESYKVDMFIMTQGKYFPESTTQIIREHLLNVNDSKWSAITSIQFLDPIISLILSILVGTFGIDRFYIGDIGLGIAKLITGGGCGIWTIVDWFLIMGATKRKNYEKLQQIC